MKENVTDNIFRFVCLKYSTLPTQSASLTSSIIVKINALSDLNKVDESNTFNTVESYGIKKLIKWLKYNHVTVIFCSDTMHDDVVHLVALEGITTVRKLLSFLFSSLSFYCFYYFCHSNYFCYFNYFHLCDFFVPLIIIVISNFSIFFNYNLFLYFFFWIMTGWSHPPLLPRAPLTIIKYTSLGHINWLNKFYDRNKNRNQFFRRSEVWN